MPENNKPLAGMQDNEVKSGEGGIVLLYVTFPDAATALKLGRELVEARLAGCANVLPVMTSVYVWQGVTETSSEAVMIAKLASENLAEATDFIRSRHPYEQPAILALPVIGGSAAYLSWVREGCRRG